MAARSSVPAGTYLLAQARERFALRDYNATYLLVKEAVTGGHDFADARHLLGLALSMLGRREEALAQFDAALARNPRYLEAHVNRAVVLADLGREAEAQQAFALAGELGRKDASGFPAAVGNRLANAHVALGHEYRQAGALEEAEAQYRRALALRPGFPDVRLALARALLERGAHADAARELDALLFTRPDLLDAVLLRGLASYLLGDLGAAGSAWERASLLAPDDPRVDTYRAMLARRRSDGVGTRVNAQP
jgi:tetratricopeptide (TPR) repeat protein